MSLFIQRYDSGSYGGMCPTDEGRYVQFNDVNELLERELGHDRATAIIHHYFDAPETSDERELVDG